MRRSASKIAAIPVLVLAALTAAVEFSRRHAVPGERLYRNTKAAVEFRYPDTYDVLDLGKDPAYPEVLYRIGLRPRQSSDLEVRRQFAGNDFALEILAYAGGVRQVAPAAGFEQRDRGWVVLGRQGLASDAYAITGPGWTGLRGTAYVGSLSQGGPYRGAGEELRALVGRTNGPSVVVVMSPPPASPELFDQVLATLRFIQE